MTKLTTHVLDVYSGKPGKGIKVDLFYINGQERSKLKSIVLNSDGRSDDPLIENDQFKIGKYELVFYIGDYFKNILKNEKLPFPSFRNKLEIYIPEVFSPVINKS